MITSHFTLYRWQVEAYEKHLSSIFCKKLYNFLAKKYPELFKGSQDEWEKKLLKMIDECRVHNISSERDVLSFSIITYINQLFARKDLEPIATRIYEDPNLSGEEKIIHLKKLTQNV